MEENVGQQKKHGLESAFAKVACLGRRARSRRGRRARSRKGRKDEEREERTLRELEREKTRLAGNAATPPSVSVLRKPETAPVQCNIDDKRDTYGRKV